jgi:TPR repeat protein
LLGALITESNGGLGDEAEAFKWLRKAAEQGNPLDQTLLGNM